jgi:hypothetical protein
MIVNYKIKIIIHVPIVTVCSSLPKYGSLPSARCFAECFLSGTRQSHTLGNDHVYREYDTRHRQTLGKDLLSVKRSANGDARKRAVSSRL